MVAGARLSYSAGTADAVPLDGRTTKEHCPMSKTLKLSSALVLLVAAATAQAQTAAPLVRSEKNWEAVARALRSNVDVALTLYRNGSWAA